MTTPLMRLARTGLVAAALADLVWVLASTLPARLASSWVPRGELAADGRPWVSAFHAGFIACHLVMGTVAAIHAVRPDPHREQTVSPSAVAWIALAVFGIGGALEGLVDSGDVRLLVCVSMAGGMIVSMAAVMITGRDCLRTLAARMAPGWLVCEVGLLSLVGAAVLLDGPVGVPQTLRILTESTWLLLVSHRLGQQSAPHGAGADSRALRERRPRLSAR